ncbi:MAG: NRDE family protein [Alphaproteobacteria bacterium]|nr:NRDE family protein [Alphaproteobacteria bacterium]
MCTVILLHRPGHAWPVMLAANRDERIDRPADPPAEYWPGILGGRDATAGGTWMAINRAGVLATVLNRPGTLGPAMGKRSRGELPLLALAADSAAEAAARIAALDAAQWRPFHMVLADRDGGWFAAGLGQGAPRARALRPGFSIITSHAPNDLADARIARHLPRFGAAAAPDSPDDWRDWPALLADTEGGPAALNIAPRSGFGTVSSALVALGAQARFHFAAGPPHTAPFAPVALA